MWALRALEGLGQTGAPHGYCFLPSVMLFVVMNGAGAGVQRVVLRALRPKAGLRVLLAL
jgi:hypothetical protein